MATSFFGGNFFGGEFFNTPAVVDEVPHGKGGRGDNGDGLRRAVKPTGLEPRRKLKAKSVDVQRRLDESQAIAGEVAGQLARELGETREAFAREEARVLNEQQVAAEIGRLLHKKIRTEEDETLLLLLLAAAATL